jgi:D-alanyl-D-alanine dipeptidase
VDLTLRDSVTEALLEMGARFEEDTDASASDYFERQLAAGYIDENDIRLQNRRLLHWAMTREGLLNETAKVVWHYDWGDQIYVRASRVFLQDPPLAAWYGFIGPHG